MHTTRRTLRYIPSSFISWNGDALDYKTPLLRSQEAINKEATRLLKHLGFEDVKEVLSLFCFVLFCF